MEHLILKNINKTSYVCLKHFENVKIFSSNIKETKDVSETINNGDGQHHIIGAIYLMKIPQIGIYNITENINNEEHEVIVNVYSNIDDTENQDTNLLDNYIDIQCKNINQYVEYVNNQYINYVTGYNEYNKKFIYRNHIWYASQRHPKTFDTLYLKESIKEGIIDTITKFENSKSVYNHYEQFYKLNLLLYGVPGSGKTCCSNAIANHFDKNIYYLNLYDFEDDNNLISVINTIKKNSIIVFEDIDCIFKNKLPNDTQRNHISMSCLLNILDGFYTIEGNIIIMTANDITCIDDSLLRSLRIDHKYNFTFLDKYQTTQILKKYVDSLSDEYILSLSINIEKRQKSPCDLIKFLFNNRDSSNIDVLLDSF